MVSFTFVVNVDVNVGVIDIISISINKVINVVKFLDGNFHVVFDVTLETVVDLDGDLDVVLE